MARRQQTKPLDEFDLTLEGRRKLTPRNGRQMALVEQLKFHSMVLAVGPAGVGKTFIPSCVAAQRLVEGAVERVIITRPTIPIDGEEIGFLPGGVRQKMGPWVEPMIEAMASRIGKDRVELAIKEERIQIVPFAFMRGRSFEKAFVIADEFQNTSEAQAKAFVTRIGEGCTYAICGDLSQTDLGPNNGLAKLVSMISRQNLEIPVIEFLSQDIVRSKLCKIWVEAFQRDELPSFLTRVS